MPKGFKSIGKGKQRRLLLAVNRKVYAAKDF
jgi:hypothetical protein